MAQGALMSLLGLQIRPADNESPGWKARAVVALRLGSTSEDAVVQIDGQDHVLKHMPVG